MVKRFWIPALAITIVYWGTYQGFEGLKFFNQVSPILKHAISFLLLALVFLIGYFTFRSLRQKEWLNKVWTFTYLAVIAILAIFGLIDIFARINSQNLRELFANIRLFFTSPVPFGILVYLGNKSKIEQERL
jgi:glucan phosphoethanolaminetransferase (alkaline phosphatase superfamily)